MKSQAVRHLDKAGELLEKALAVSSRTAPEAVIHLAYYAIFHAAVAALIHSGENVPRRHGAVIAAFGKMVKDEDEAAKQAGRNFNLAYELRRAADYDVGRGDRHPDAEHLTAWAADMVAFCRRLISKTNAGA